MIVKEEIKWVAGVFDSFARFTIAKTDKYWKVAAQIRVSRPSDKDMVTDMAELAGLSSSVRKNIRKVSADYYKKACVEHCPEPHVHVMPLSDKEFVNVRLSGALLDEFMGEIQRHTHRGEEYEMLYRQCREQRKLLDDHKRTHHRRVSRAVVSDLPTHEEIEDVQA